MKKYSAIILLIVAAVSVCCIFAFSSWIVDAIAVLWSSACFSLLFARCISNDKEVDK